MQTNNQPNEAVSSSQSVSRTQWLMVCLLLMLISCLFAILWIKEKRRREYAEQRLAVIEKAMNLVKQMGANMPMPPATGGQLDSLPESGAEAGKTDNADR